MSESRRSTGTPVCPWCGDDLTDSPADVPTPCENWQIECASCGGPVLVSSEATIIYDTWQTCAQALMPAEKKEPR